MSDFEKQKCCKLAKLSSRINTILEDFRGRYEDLKVLELSEFELQQALQVMSVISTSFSTSNSSADAN